MRVCSQGLGLIIWVAAWWRCWVDALRGLVLLFYRVKQTDLSFEETLISFCGFSNWKVDVLYTKLGEKLHCLPSAQQQSPPLSERTRWAPVRVLLNTQSPPYCSEPLKQPWILAQLGWDSGEARQWLLAWRGAGLNPGLSVSADPKSDVPRQ